MAAERVHRPGSRRLGGVEATGAASPGVAPSRPHRPGPRAGPVRRPPAAGGAGGGERAGGWASDLPAVANCVAGRRLAVPEALDERAYWFCSRPAHLKKKGTRYTLFQCSSSKSA